jgi:hypothetical protein
MVFPDPQPGRRGQEEGRKDRPCVIVLRTTVDKNGHTFVRVAPITHSEPEHDALAIEIPLTVKQYLGLDSERSWVILDELNEFVWPGFDIRPLGGKPQGYAYGYLPPALFNQLLRKLGTLYRRR